MIAEMVIIDERSLFTAHPTLPCESCKYAWRSTSRGPGHCYMVEVFPPAIDTFADDSADLCIRYQRHEFPQAVWTDDPLDELDDGLSLTSEGAHEK